MIDSAFFETVITRFNDKEKREQQDVLAVEEPLEICLKVNLPEEKIIKTISVTMRTPGYEAELAAGFLFTENVLQKPDQICSIIHEQWNSNNVTIEVVAGFFPELQKMDRNFYTTSSCGVCGKTSIEALQTKANFKIKACAKKIGIAVLYSLHEKLLQAQKVFETTGGLHAAALFDGSGNLLALREDVGRHNALDKLIGTFFLKNKMPLSESILMLSGRASFELLQKAAAAGIPFVAAVGAPSSLAVQTAKKFGITLIGFLRNNGFNIYSNPDNIEE